MRPPLFSKTQTSPFSLQQFNQLVDLGPLVGGVATSDRAFDALAEMVLEDRALDLAKRGPDRLQLGQYVDAVAALGDHLRDAADLAFDAVEAADQFRVMVCHSVVLIPTTGILQYAPAGYM